MSRLKERFEKYMTPERVAELLKDGVLQAYAKRESLQFLYNGKWMDYIYNDVSDEAFDQFAWRKRIEPRELFEVFHKESGEMVLRTNSRANATEYVSNRSNYYIEHYVEVLD